MPKLAKAAIEDFMKLWQRRSFQPSAIYLAIGVPASHASLILQDLVAEGKVEHLGRGRYKWKG